jgi:putative colanic acid biosynthesis glycosyltransferase
MPEFSIITICRNNLNELIYTLESIKSQAYIDFEWIVIDGDSSDGTKNWLMNNQFKKNWISEPDKGIFDAMNKGIRMSEGKYLIFLNSGDAFSDTEVLSKTHDSILQNTKEPTFIYGDSHDIDESGKVFQRKAKDHLLIKRGMITQHQAMFFNKIHLPEIKFDLQFKVTADYALACEVIRKAGSNNILKVGFPICKFKMGGTNETHRFRALTEDYKIRRVILNLSVTESVVLFILHFVHTLLKKISPSLRFIKHQQVNQNVNHES